MPKLKMQTIKFVGPVLTAAMRAAGIVAITSGQHANGSYTCLVKLRAIQRKEEINPRKLSDQHVAEIEKDFDWSCWDNPKIVLQWVGGKLMLYHINGAHSIKVGLNHLSEDGITTCQVFFFLSDKQCAKIFYQPAIRTKRIESWDAYASALLAGDTFFTQVRDAIVAQELTTPVDMKEAGQPKSRADIGAFDPIKKVAELENDGFRKLDRLLMNLVVFKEQTDGLMSRDAKGIEFVRGLHDFADYTEGVLGWSLKKLREQLDTIWPEEVQEKAAEFMRVEKKTRSTRKHFNAAFKVLLRVKTFTELSKEFKEKPPKKPRKK